MKIYNALQIKSLDMKQHLPLMMRAICNELIEIGCVLRSGVNENAHVILTDLTGIAPQDIAIAKYVVDVLVPRQH